MTDVTQMWKDVHQESRTKRAKNRQSGAEQLTTAGVVFVSRNMGAHLIVGSGDDRVDYWPGTGKWKAVDGKQGRGIKGLLVFLKQDERA